MDVDGDEGDEAEDNEQMDDSDWHGIRKDIGILTESEFQTVMTKCLRAMGKSVSRVNDLVSVDGMDHS